MDIDVIRAVVCIAIGAVAAYVEYRWGRTSHPYPDCVCHRHEKVRMPR